ncbi:MAG: hypothetical protein GW762_03665 [Candidatus Pacebacteria bacterium]|nr:hypothetical protein [Candidatus Paceibacterota bacterium]PIR63586.1 MAG: hypothetical protein COU64_03975 [Candidatus Pacebacteria bacterium CG10_big_fil_rev_8_21_14_0_10_40_26]PIZ79243.1 MAG: hypothetical protein COY01_02350 [Candidatus Pacebacteria bacterium CG_4_10_14_0_2_um_filter_40_20]PJA68898.1 MAG: hypothetical protein CO156_02955 [Candidatus Pacebacteria bacterium CG_4_9_14_3_um_filter_40_12]PJC42210.1 MAG: hypothetical protein CO041_01060 [Candidatus Pacebacteria bacterium CG_4_9_
MKTARPIHTLKKIATLADALGVGTLLFSNTIFAQDFTQTDDTVTLTAIPPRVGDQEPIKLAPGAKEQVQLRIRNNSTKAITINSVAQDFMLDLDGQTPIPLNEDSGSRWSLADWLVVAPNQQTIEPQETAGTSVLIEVPEDALPGGHYAMVTHEPTTGVVSEDGESASVISQKVGSLFYVIVDGVIHEEAFIRDFSFPQLTEVGPVDFSFFVDNQSDIHIKPQVSIEIYNLFNQKIDTIQIESKNVFPLYSRGFSGSWDRVWGHGFYTAKLIMSYGEQGNVALASTTFWLFPVKIVLSILVIILVLLAMLISIRRHILHKNQDKDKQIKELEDQLAEVSKDQLEKHEE